VEFNETGVPVPEQPEEQVNISKPKQSRKKPNIIPIIAMGALFVIAIGLALTLSPVYDRLGMRADFTEIGGGEEESVINPLIYITVILVATAIILFIGRRKRGGFLKYAFLGIICITVVYVFFPFFAMALYPSEFTEEWDVETQLDHPVSVIEIDDLDNDDVQEIIIGTKDGYVFIYDGNTHEEKWGSVKLGATIKQLKFYDMNNDGNNELVINSGNIMILSGSGTTYTELTRTLNDDYTSFDVGRLGNNSQNSIVACNGTNDISIMNLNNSILEIQSISGLGISVNVVEVANIDNIGPVEVFLLGQNIFQILDSSDFSELATKPFDKITDLVGLMVKDVYFEQNDQIVVWNRTGNLMILSYPDLTTRWEEDVGNNIGGVEVYDLFSAYEDREIIVSVDGKVYVYLNEDKDYKYEFVWHFSSELGKLNKDAEGLAVGDIDNNLDDEIIVGHEGGYKSEEIRGLNADIYGAPCYLALIIAIFFGILLFKYPEWYVVDFVGIVVAAGVCAIIGISLAILPILVLLIILAVYDAISVYKTKHMVDLADKVVDWHLPILLVIPKTLKYSFLKQKGLKKQLKEGTEREAMFMGLGDIIIPGTLAISAFNFLNPVTSWGGVSSNLIVAIGVLVGTLVGFSALMRYVIKGNPQAGLPLLNSGAISGYFITYWLVYQDLSFGLSFVF
jgi:presenilin-like A22 family membrane protease